MVSPHCGTCQLVTSDDEMLLVDGDCLGAVSEIRGSELAGAGVSGARPSHNSRSHAGHWAGTGHVTWTKLLLTAKYHKNKSTHSRN